MSRIGKIPVDLPDKVEAKIDGKVVTIKGPKGELSLKLVRGIEVKKQDSKLVVSTKSGSKQARTMHGTTRAHLNNMVRGVTEGWSKQLELVGTGYRAETSGGKLKLTVGYSHPVEVEAPEGVSFKVEKTEITVDGIDKQVVGEVAAKIRSIRPPEPYKGKGIRYKDEEVRRKAGKAAKATGAAAA